MRLLMSLVLAFVLVVFFKLPFAHSESAKGKSHKTTTTTTTTTRDQDGDDDDDETVSTPAQVRETEPIEKIIEETFGSQATAGMAGCKTEDLAKDAIAGLKSDCNAWIKDRKTELKSRYVTGSCRDKCDDCGMSLKRCFVTGSVHYTLR